jgi:hypothetical protein
VSEAQGSILIALSQYSADDAYASLHHLQVIETWLPGVVLLLAGILFFAVVGAIHK